MPEDIVIEYGMSEKSLYFVAHGKCLINVTNHLRAKSFVRELEEG